jgi:hypothetical protein
MQEAAHLRLSHVSNHGPQSALQSRELIRQLLHHRLGRSCGLLLRLLLLGRWRLLGLLCVWLLRMLRWGLLRRLGLLLLLLRQRRRRPVSSSRAQRSGRDSRRLVLHRSRRALLRLRLLLSPPVGPVGLGGALGGGRPLRRRRGRGAGAAGSDRGLGGGLGCLGRPLGCPGLLLLNLSISLGAGARLRTGRRLRRCCRCAAPGWRGRPLQGPSNQHLLFC